MKVCLECDVKFESKGWECPSCHQRPKNIGGYPAFAPELTKHSVGFSDEIFEQLADIEDRNFWFRSRSRLIIWSLRKYFSNAQNFFEVGCGNGYVLSCIERTFPKMKLYGGEVFVTGLGFASKRLARADLIQMDARNIPFEDEFEVMSAFDVLEHIEDDGLVLKRMHRAVRQGGGIILTVPQHPFLWSQTDEYAHHVRRYTAKELRAKVENVGFEVLKMTSFVSILLPLMIISRFNKRKSALECDSMPELKVNNLTNFVFEKILDFERLIISLGISLPFGGSLLLVARKTAH
jgi:SAM-dependent methyltransferase